MEKEKVNKELKTRKKHFTGKRNKTERQKQKKKLELHAKRQKKRLARWTGQKMRQIHFFSFNTTNFKSHNTTNKNIQQQGDNNGMWKKKTLPCVKISSSGLDEAAKWKIKSYKEKILLLQSYR